MFLQPRIQDFQSYGKNIHKTKQNKTKNHMGSTVIIRISSTPKNFNSMSHLLTIYTSLHLLQVFQNLSDKGRKTPPKKTLIAKGRKREKKKKLFPNAP